MPRDWPDPRWPDKPISPIAVVLVGQLVAFGYGSMIWGVIQMVRSVIGLQAQRRPLAENRLPAVGR